MSQALAPIVLSAEDAEQLRAFERRGHDQLAASYCDFFAPITALAVEPLLEAVHLRPGMRLLDVATGPGAVAAAALARGADPAGIDLSAGMIELARRGHPGIAFLEAEVEHLPFPEGTFDAVVCNFALGHFPYPDAALAECLRVLKPGGRLAFSWWDEPGRQRIQGLFRETIAELEIPPPAAVPAGHTSLRFCNAHEFLRLLGASHLTDVMLEGHATSYRVASADALWQGGLGSMVLTAAALRAQDAATREAARVVFARRASTYMDERGLNIPIAFRIGAGSKPL